MLSEPANHISFRTMSTSVQLLSLFDNDELVVLPKITYNLFKCHIQCNVSKCLQNLPNAVQLLHLEVHTPGMLARCDMLFQLMFSDLSGTQINSETVTTSNLIVIILQSM